MKRILKILVVATFSSFIFSSCIFHTRTTEQLLEDEGGVIYTVEIDKKDLNKLQKAEQDTLFKQIIDVLYSRAKSFNIRKPNIQRIKSTNHILLELPGIQTENLIKESILKRANLEFWETYDNTEIFEFLSDANDIIRKLKAYEQFLDTTELENNKRLKAKPKNIENDNLTLLERAKQEDPFSEIAESNRKVESIKAERENPLFFSLHPYVHHNGQLVKNTSTVGFCKTTDTSKVNTYLNLDEVQKLLPLNLKLMWENKPYDENTEFLRLHAIKITNKDGSPVLAGDVISEAKAQFAYNTVSAEVNIVMNKAGSGLWAKITRENINRQVAIAVDGKVFTAPTVNREITGGRSSISGDFSIEEATALANNLKSGSLPVSLKIIEEKIIAPAQK